jgi:hypothetical protein
MVSLYDWRRWELDDFEYQEAELGDGLRLRDPATRAKIRDAVETSLSRGGSGATPGTMLVTRTPFDVRGTAPAGDGGSVAAGQRDGGRR